MPASANISYSNITIKTQLGLENASLDADCEIVEYDNGEVLHCIYNVTVQRTSNGWGVTYVYIDMEMLNIVDNQVAYMYKDNEKYDNASASLTIEYKFSCLLPIYDPSEYNECLWNETSSPEYFRTYIPVPLLADWNYPQYYNFTVEIYYSHDYISTCESYVTTDVDEFEIDPTIENPVGPDVIPGDDQIYPTVVDQSYKLYMTGGPWNNGSAQQDRDKIEYSWDGITWSHFYGATCHELIGGELVDVYILVAESDSFYIRVWDSPGQFADNYNDPDPVYYHIALIFPVSNCESQYSYDPFDDLIGFTGVDSTKWDGALLSNVEELIVGDWYVVRWNYGDWRDNGGPSQIDVEYNWLPHTTGWENLAEGSTAVWCVSSDGLEVLFQAHATNIFLRADDEDDNFPNNSGTVYYDLYHVTFTRKPEPCEAIVNIDTMIEAIIVDADKWNGSPVGTAMETTIQPGGWYVLDTTLGPWRQTTGADRYDMAILDEPAGSASGTWIELEDFEASCNIETDTLGHRRIIFQAPDDYAYDGSQGHYYRLRVDRDFLGLYLGSMGWQLYGATSTAATIDTCLDGLNLQVINEFEWIDEKRTMGEMLLSDNIRWPEYVALQPGTTYVVQSPVDATGQCAGDPGSECKFQITKDGGENWYQVDDVPSPLECAVKEDAPSTRWKGRFTVAEGETWMIRVNDIDGNFTNNTGETAFKLYKDCSGESCIPISENDLPTISIQGGGDICRIAVMRPGSLTTEALVDLGSYLGNWIQYLNLSVLRYMAWCPSHTNKLMNFVSAQRNKEPFASYVELDDTQQRIKDEIDSYDWGENAGQAKSIFEMTASGELSETVEDVIFSRDIASSPWEGGNAINFNDSELPPSYYACQNTFVASLPSGLRTGVCFVSAYFVETSASFWIQLTIDISALFAALMLTKDTIIDLVYVFTGVQLKVATKAEAGRLIRSDEIGEYARSERRPRWRRK